MTKDELIARSQQAEKHLALLYASAAITSIIATVSIAIAWQHWAWTLDVCISVECSCILYGVNTFSTFMGGDAAICRFTSCALTPALGFGLILGIYHGYRTCIHRKLDQPRSVTTPLTYNRQNHSNIIVIRRKERSPFKQWIPSALLGAVICCLSLAQAIVMIDGYYKSCDQYRRNLIQLVGASGRESQVILNRLSCGTIFDYMDYLQPDANNWRRGDEINTGLALQFAIIASWLNFFVWLTVIVVNSIMIRRRKIALNELTCCCC